MPLDRLDECARAQGGRHLPQAGSRLRQVFLHSLVVHGGQFTFAFTLNGVAVFSVKPHRRFTCIQPADLHTVVACILLQLPENRAADAPVPVPLTNRHVADPRCAIRFGMQPAHAHDLLPVVRSNVKGLFFHFVLLAAMRQGKGLA